MWDVAYQGARCTVHVRTRTCQDAQGCECEGPKGNLGACITLAYGGVGPPLKHRSATHDATVRVSEGAPTPSASTNVLSIAVSVPSIPGTQADYTRPVRPPGFRPYPPTPIPTTRQGAVSMVVSQLLHVDSPFGFLAAFMPGAGAGAGAPSSGTGAGGGGGSGGSGGAASPGAVAAAGGSALVAALTAGGRVEVHEGPGALLQGQGQGQGQGGAGEGPHNRASIDMSRFVDGSDTAQGGQQQQQQGVVEQQGVEQSGEEQDGVELGGVEQERHLQAAEGGAGGSLVAAAAHWLTQLTGAGAAATAGAGTGNAALAGTTGGGGALQPGHKEQQRAVTGLAREQAETRAARAAASLGAMYHHTPTASSAGQQQGKVAAAPQTQHHHQEHQHHHHHQQHTGVHSTGHGTSGAGPHTGAQRGDGSSRHGRRRQARGGGTGWRWRRALVSKATWGTRTRGR